MTEPRHSPAEDRLRAALAERANTIDPSPDGLSRIEEKLMSDSRSIPRWAVGLGSAAAAVIVTVLVVFIVDDDDTDVVSDSTTTTEETTTTETTTTTESTTTTTEAPAVVDPTSVAWPAPGSQSFDTPEAAGTAYATDVLGFTRMTDGEFRQGDSRSGEWVFSDRADGRETTILVRQMEDDFWYVLGSATEDITVDTPTARDTLTSPFSTTGSALAFEGHVNVVVLTQSDLREVGQGFVTGSGTPPAGPFEGEISYDAPSDDTPAIVIYFTGSAEDGHVEMAASFPVVLSATS